MTDIKLLPEPAAGYGRGCNIELADGQPLYTAEQVRANVAHATAAQEYALADAARSLKAARSARDEAHAEIGALRAEVEKWEARCEEEVRHADGLRESITTFREGMKYDEGRVKQAEARAERLAEALREIESVAQGYVKDVASDYLRDHDQEVGNG